MKHQAIGYKQIATQLWILTGETILMLHVSDINLLSLLLKKSRRKKSHPTFFWRSLRM
jgi:hypothetical protein